MSDIMRPIPFAQLMDWALTEYQEQGSLFGVTKLVRYKGGHARPIFHEKIESPYGPAAGPHTQLAQNIIAAYAAGARFFELKTVQVVDGEALAKCVAKPCISAGDEGYNCEWSTELTVPQAFQEYVKAWFACKLLARELNLGDPDAFVFNMSVGYDLAGIQSEKIDRYIENMKDASGTAVWEACMDWALSHVKRFRNLDGAYIRGISPLISSSITESTLHGCPPDEIERIAAYLITEKGLNTYVKCNPTLLGYEFARQLLDSMGFRYMAFDDRHFVEDLQWRDAVPMFRRLMALCSSRGLEFGVKLSNTFPVDVTEEELPSQEMYMSGRALFPLTISLASRFAAEFDGKLRISYSGGADAHNVRALVQAGIWPVTMATTLLKPGGYQRMSQIGALLADCGAGPFREVDKAAVSTLAAGAAEDPLYRKPIKPVPSKKIGRKVPLMDCFTAPCRSGCPIKQDIPAYLMAVERGDYAGALRIITQRNPLPFITGAICPHPCAGRCMRGYYEAPVSIRECKHAAAEGGYRALLSELRPKASRPDIKVAVVGGGPAGMAAAYFLGREGIPVTIFEATGMLGGVVRQLIPEFRISKEDIDRDEQMVLAMGAEVRYHTRIRSASELEGMGYTHVIFATGAQKAVDPGLQYGPYINFTEVLAGIKSGAVPDLGTDVAVIGGGNSAMDTARAVKRLPGVEHVRLIYRRTRQYMPADEEELRLALEDGVEFMELLSPVGVKDGVLTCAEMELGAPDHSGRRAPVHTGRRVDLPCTALVAAVGQEIDGSVDVGGWPVIGDRKRGPATVVEAIADAAEAAGAIVELDLDRYGACNLAQDTRELAARKGELCTDCIPCTGSGCLGCPTVCEVCADVCPNRANVAVTVPGMQQRQIIHVDGMCNECGNCATFCPYDSRPYRDKFTLFWSREDFDSSENEGFLPGEDGTCLVRLNGRTMEYDGNSTELPDGIGALIQAVRERYPYLLRREAAAHQEG